MTDTTAELARQIADATAAATTIDPAIKALIFGIYGQPSTPVDLLGTPIPAATPKPEPIQQGAAWIDFRDRDAYTRDHAARATPARLAPCAFQLSFFPEDNAQSLFTL